MNRKMTTNSQLSTNEPKRKEKQQKLSKQLEQEQNQRMDITQREFSRKGEGWNGGKRYREEEAWLVGIK